MQRDKNQARNNPDLFVARAERKLAKGDKDGARAALEELEAGDGRSSKHWTPELEERAEKLAKALSTKKRSAGSSEPTPADGPSS